MLNKISQAQKDKYNVPFMIHSVQLTETHGGSSEFKGKMDRKLIF